MADALVAIHERVVLDQGEPQSRGFRTDGGIGLNTTGRYSRLSNSRLQSCQVPDGSCPAGQRHYPSVQLNDFPEREIPHSGKPAIQGFVGGKDVLGRALEVVSGAGE